MIAGILHQGSGLGNQLFRYVATRVKAEELGVPFGMVNAGGFKGASFMDIDLGQPVPGTFTIEANTGKAYIDVEGFKLFEEKSTIENGLDIRSYDPEWNFIEDNTIIDGEFQDDKYWGSKLYYVNKWLKTEELNISDNVCVIGFRGGEFTVFPDLYLTKEYWETAIDHMLKKNYHMRFVCVTDDPVSARAMLPEHVKITHEIGTDWRMIRYAKNLIIANSSFYILPALLNRRAEEVIAPRYWARRNTGQWATPANYYKRFLYL